MTVEKVQGISRLEQLCEEFSEEERVRELKQEKKRQKRKNRRKNKCVCDIPTPLQTADEKEVNQEKVVFFAGRGRKGEKDSFIALPGKGDHSRLMP